jgi:hypothetical protein
MDLSPLTSFYKFPLMQLYSAAEVISTIRSDEKMIKLNLSSGFFQIPISLNHRQYYGIHYEGVRFCLARLPMGHPLAPSVLQRLAQAVDRYCVANTRLAWFHAWIIG